MPLEELSREELIAIIVAQQKTIQELTARIAELEERLNKDSHNSSKPPSSDGYKKPSPKSLRQKSGRKVGGQKGHNGHNIKIDTPDRIENIYPERCSNCPHKENCADLRICDTCYVVDIVVKKETVKYQMMECNCEGIRECAARPVGINGSVTYGNMLKSFITILNTQGMIAHKNICGIIEGLTGIHLSAATVNNMIKSAAKQAKLWLPEIQQSLHNEPVVHNDETGERVNGKLSWVHVVCSALWTYYALSEKRGRIGMDEVGFLKEYHGISVHDFWMSYFSATTASHAMCGAHLLRELTGIYENHPEQEWAGEMHGHLLNMSRVAEFYNQNPEIGSREHYMNCLKEHYDEILQKAIHQNPIFEKTGRKGKPKRGKIRCLIDRLVKYKGEVCRFADNPLVPFTNNQAERDLRMVRLKSKVIGCFRTASGAENFLAIKSVISSAIKHGYTAFQAVLSLLSHRCAWMTE